MVEHLSGSESGPELSCYEYGVFRLISGAAVPLPLTSMKLITLRPSFWLALKGAEAGQDDKSQ